MKLNPTSPLYFHQLQVGGEDAINNASSSFTANKSAGIISVFANHTQHKSVITYLKDVEKYASAQVLIEAKVVEVTLNKDFAFRN